jgi:hypothetical protein
LNKGTKEKGKSGVPLPKERYGADLREEPPVVECQGKASGDSQGNEVIKSF